jgi:hypothetical protein
MKPEPVAKPKPVICEDCYKEIEPGTEHEWYIDYLGGCGDPDHCTSMIDCKVVPSGALV